MTALGADQVPSVRLNNLQQFTYLVALITVFGTVHCQGEIKWFRFHVKGNGVTDRGTRMIREEIAALEVVGISPIQRLVITARYLQLVPARGG